MAIGWLTVLKLVPWSDVISNAPKVADGAKKLWSAAARKPASAEMPLRSEQAELTPDAQSIAVLQAQLTAADAAISDLHNQMLASSELIKALAEQNTQLIQRVEVNRVRVLWLSGATAVLAVFSVASLVLTLAR